jgi:O-antigen/teichoic acid export membrane protein
VRFWGRLLAQLQSGGPSSLFVLFRDRLGLRSTAARATAWTYGSFAISQTVRVGSHLLLARMLAPEAFGLLLIVQLLLSAIRMFSDLGVGAAVVQNPRGGEPRFLQTAWTLGIVTSVARWAIASAVAWPLARHFDEPLLLYLVPVVAMTAVIDSFTSMKVDALERRLEVKRVVIIDLASYIVSVAVMLGATYVLRNVWGLVIGGLTYSVISTILTHVALPGPPARFAWDREVLRQLVRFGKWLFFSSILTYIATYIDDIILANLVTTAELGLYSIGAMLAQYGLGIVAGFSGGILFPLFSRAAEEGPHAVRGKIFRIRAIITVLFVPPLWFLAIFGQEVVDFLYDARYTEAGWIVQWLSVAAIPVTILAPAESLILSSGNSFRHMLVQFADVIILTLALGIGAALYGMPGVVGGVVVGSFLCYIALAVLVRPYGGWIAKLDLPALAISGAVVGLGWWLT